MQRYVLVRLTLLTALLAAVLPATQASAQELIEGAFEGQVFTGGQGTGNSGTGAMVLRGWALAASGVRLVVIQVDGVDDGAAILGRLRPDIETGFPGFPDSSAAGFTYRLNSTRYLNGPHFVSAKVITRDGAVEDLPGGRTFFFNNNTTILKPFGTINKPLRNAHVFGTCDLSDPRRRLVPVEGWVLDLGVETNDAGVGYVELMIDNQPFFNTRTGCSFIFDAGGFTNCFGLPRPDVERLYPFAKDAPNAGYRFVLDIGFMITALRYVEGQHLLTIRSGDISNQVADVDEIPVVFRCIEGIPNEGAFGLIESPRPGSSYAGNMLVQGWVLDAEGVDRVLIHIDGTFVGQAAYGTDDGIFATRPGVFSQYPGFPEVEAPVFRLRPNFDTTNLSDGSHQLQVYVLDREGIEILIGEVSFFVDNRDDG